MSELLSIVVEVQPERAGNVPLTNAVHLHGWFFDKLLTRFDPALAAYLHSQNHKSFTLSNLQAYKPALQTQRGLLLLQPSERYWFRLTSFDRELSERLVGPVGLIRAVDNVLGQVLQVRRVYTEAGQHPWAGQADYAELLAQGERTTGLGESTRVRLEFVSVTTIKSSNPYVLKGNQVLPLPRLVWGELARRWEMWGGPSAPPDFGSLVEERVHIAQYALATETVRLKSEETGFRGWCEYVANGTPPNFNAFLHTLSHFAFYAGVGRKTTMGCGQAVLQA